MKETNPRLTRWYLALQPFAFTVQYRKGAEHVNVNYFSRQGPWAKSEEERTALLDVGVCETQGESIEALTRVSSSLKIKQEAQTNLPAPPIETKQWGVDTWELEWELLKMTVVTQTENDRGHTSRKRGKWEVHCGGGNGGYKRTC